MGKRQFHWANAKDPSGQGMQICKEPEKKKKRTGQNIVSPEVVKMKSERWEGARSELSWAVIRILF